MAHSLLVVDTREGLQSKEKQFFRSIAATEEIVQEEIVQLIGSDEVFGLLRYASVLGDRHQFGADGRVGDIEQHSLELVGILEAVVRRPDHQSPDESLGHACVHAVH